MHIDHIRLRAWAAHVGDKAGALGSVVSAMGCAMCFPALASAPPLSLARHGEGYSTPPTHRLKAALDGTWR